MHSAYQIPRKLLHRRSLDFAQRSSLLQCVRLALLGCFLTAAVIWLVASQKPSRLCLHDSLCRVFPRHVQSIEIFTAPKPVTTESSASLHRAVSSWKALEPQPKIVLLGEAGGLAEEAVKLGVSHDPNVDHSFMGLPLFNSLISRVNSSKADIAVFINSDIMLLQDFISSLNKVASSFPDFIMIGARYDIDFLPKFTPESESMRDYVLRLGTLHAYGGMDFWAWNLNGPPLFKAPMPPFVFARGKYDNWFTHQAIESGRRKVVDASETCVSVHLPHNYSVVGTTQSLGAGNEVPELERELGQASDKTSPSARKLQSFWSYGKSTKFELFMNIYHSLNTGSYINGYGSTLHAPWKLSNCLEPSGMCLIQRYRPGMCYCEYSHFVRKAKPDPKLTRTGLPKPRCAEASIDSPGVFQLPIRATGNRPIPFGMPLTIDQALEKVSINKTVIVSALNFGYRSVMMNWICNMRRLGISNVIVAALDPQLYVYAFSRGIASYYEDSFDKGISEAVLYKEGAYGSSQFKKLTKMKTQVVSRILKMGYNVVWSDCDIVFFKNPLAFMWGEPDADIIIQSNAPDSEVANNKGRINSGFYLAKSKPSVIRALDEVIRHALRSRKSEQPCFYDVLCGLEKERTVGGDRCEYNGVRLKLLDRGLFPNGGTQGIWDLPAGTITQRFPDLYLLHNNWIVGVDRKAERLRRHGFVMFDEAEEVCFYGSATKR